MKHIKLIFAVAFLAVITVTAQEKKIKFNTGTLKICSSKNFQIEGYDGKEVIIKSLHSGKSFVVANGGIRSAGNRFTYSTGGKGKLTVKPTKAQKLPKGQKNQKSTFIIANGSRNNLFFSRTDQSKTEGLKRLGKKQENKELGIYFTIEKKNGELIFRDNAEGQLTMFGNEKYSIKIPNSLKLNWDTSACKKNSKAAPRVWYSSNASSLFNFNGEVEISTSLNNLKLTDVTGPVSINSIGGNVTIDFDKKKPLKLYSIYTNNGFIDVTMPANSDINVDANGAAIYSNLDFKILSDTEFDGQQHMKLKIKKGRVKMKLEAGFGTIYLRKKK